MVLAPGHHRVQVMRGSEIAGPGLLLLAPGESRVLAGRLSAEDLDVAAASLLANRPRAVPDPVKAAAEAWRLAQAGDPVWLAAWRGRGEPALLPLSGDDPWIPVTWPDEVLFLLEARLGGGIVHSDTFREPDLEDRAAPAGGVGVTGEVVWGPLLLKAEIDALQASGTITYGTREEGTDATTSRLVRVAVAPGFYLVRPRPRGLPWHVALPVGLLTPAHVGWGLETGLGLPVGREGWIRPTVDVWFGSTLEGFRGTRAITGVLRVGYARKL
jgi:hypothetical protein